MNIGNLGATYALVDPTDHVAENALAVVVELLLHLLRRKIRACDRHGQQSRERWRRPPLELTLARGDIDLVIMQRVQGGRRRRGEPRRCLHPPWAGRSSASAC